MANHRPPGPSAVPRASTIIATDPEIGIECSVCLEPVTLTTRALMSCCPHVFHRNCIDEWHGTQLRRGRPPNCPVCRTLGTAAASSWPIYTFSRSMWGPWGSVAITPDLLIVNARYWFSQPTKQLVRYSDIARYYRNRNCIFLVDSVGAILTSFSVRKPRELFEALAAASVKHFERQGAPRRWRTRPMAGPPGTLPINLPNNVSAQNNGMHYEP